jgi:hypothetical protein
MRRLAWYVRHADLEYTIADARPVTEEIVEGVHDRVYATFGEWTAGTPTGAQAQSLRARGGGYF